MNPKISDFGLAKLFCESQTHGSTNRISGTFGYIAPEYVMNGKFSTKSDVYSFGILVLEIITGRRNSSFRNSTNLQSHAWEHWSKGTALELMDPTMGDEWPRHEALKCIQMGLLCVQEAAANRPKMSEVVLILDGYAVSRSMPSRPGFFISEESDDSLLVLDFQLDEFTTKESHQSVNQVTITELNPRD
ncbi:cysteine-rich receptor-like protein kinase 34 [Ziziphus jujuba]|uniref:Cysteine-rich receptor-like protein kinase 34 n=1 Tax=Ziziphus jujuba TaxID=326968 RepID=A0ABM4A798_ZIZJJ|nr:cysteine-rich receptor-like protein kinase 34 [Ziziphus jujuba]